MGQFSRHRRPSLFLLCPALIPDDEEPDQHGDEESAGLEVWNPFEARQRGRISEKNDGATGADYGLAPGRNQAAHQYLHLLLSLGCVNIRFARDVIYRQNAVSAICNNQGDVRADDHPLELEEHEV